MKLPILNKQKYLFLIMENRKVKQVLSGGKVGTSERGEDIRKGCRRMKVVEI
jgi:hypothetical protein